MDFSLFGGDAADFDSGNSKLLAWILVFFPFRLLVRRATGLRRESVRFQTTPEREKAALRFAESFWVRNFRVSGQLAQAICR